MRRLLLLGLLACSAGGADDTTPCNLEGTYSVNVQLVRDALGPITPVDDACLDAIEAGSAPSINRDSVTRLCPWVRLDSTCQYGRSSEATVVSADECTVQACYGDVQDRNLVADGVQGSDCAIAVECVASDPNAPCPGAPVIVGECEYAVTLQRAGTAQ